MTAINVDLQARVFLDPAQLSAIVADYLARQGLKAESVMYAVGPTKKGVIILGGQAVGCLGASVTLDPACVADAKSIAIPDAQVRTYWDDEDAPKLGGN